MKKRSYVVALAFVLAALFAPVARSADNGLLDTLVPILDEALEEASTGAAAAAVEFAGDRQIERRLNQARKQFDRARTGLAPLLPGTAEKAPAFAKALKRVASATKAGAKHLSKAHGLEPDERFEEWGAGVLHPIHRLVSGSLQESSHFAHLAPRAVVKRHARASHRYETSLGLNGMETAFDPAAFAWSPDARRSLGPIASALKQSIGLMAFVAANGDQAGSLALLATDAPLGQLTTLTIDISSIKLTRAGGTTVQVLPAPGAPANAPITIDLLSLVGLNQLLSFAAVPAGTYESIDIEYGNPRAVDSIHIPQTVHSASNTLTVVLRPALQIAPGTQSALQLDFDLSRSVIELGPTELLLLPVVNAQALGPDSPAAITTVVGRVLSVDPGTDTVEVAFVLLTGQSLGGAVTQKGVLSRHSLGGRLSLVGTPDTVVVDAGGTLSQGSVAQRLAPGDVVLLDAAVGVDGLLHPTDVTVLAGGGEDALPTLIEGTLLAHDPLADRVGLRIDRALALDGGKTPLRLSDNIVEIPDEAVVRRGGTSLARTELTPGNRLRLVVRRRGPGDYFAERVAELPSVVAGTVDSMLVPKHETNTTIRLIPNTINRIPVGYLPFPAVDPLEVDVPDGTVVGHGEAFTFAAFFDGTEHLTTHGSSGTTGMLPQPDDGPGHGASTVIRGTVDGSAALNADGNVQFAMIASETSPKIEVVGHELTHVVQQGGGPVIMAKLSATAAVEALNASPALVEVEGSVDPSGSHFVATVAIRIQTAALPDPDAPIEDALLGTIRTQATLGLDGKMTFTLARTRSSAGDAVAVSVPPEATLETVQPGTGGATVTPLTMGQAAAALNASPRAVHVVGRYDAITNTFDATVSVRILP